MTPRRVLVVSHLAFPHVGGVETLIDLEIRALVTAGCTVTLLTSDGTGQGTDPQYPATVNVIRVPAWHGPEVKLGIPYPVFGPRLLPSLWRAVRDCDVVHAHGFVFQNSVLAVLLAAWLRKPCLLTDHGGIQKFASRPATLLARLAAETVGRVSTTLATRVLTYNGRIRRDLARLRRRNDVEFLANPVDRTRFRPPAAAEKAEARRALGWPADSKVVLFVGRLIPTKGVPLLLAAAEPDYDVVFCGPGDVSQLGELPRPGVRYLPPRPQAELIRAYWAADVLALPAEVREGFPLVVQEAACCSLPVVLGYDPGYEPYRGVANLVFTERTVEAVRAAIRTALSMASTVPGDVFPDSEAWLRKLYRFPAT